MKRWYYLKDGKTTGPVTEKGLLDLMRWGQLSADELVYQEGDAKWRPVREFPELDGRHLDSEQSADKAGWVLLKKKPGEKKKFVQVGPFSANQVRKRVKAGEFVKKDLIWKDGMSQWLPLMEVDVFQDLFVELDPVPTSTATPDEPTFVLHQVEKSQAHEEPPPLDAEGPDLTKKQLPNEAQDATPNKAPDEAPEPAASPSDDQEVKVRLPPIEVPSERDKASEEVRAKKIQSKIDSVRSKISQDQKTVVERARAWWKKRVPKDVQITLRSWLVPVLSLVLFAMSFAFYRNQRFKAIQEVSAPVAAAPTNTSRTTQRAAKAPSRSRTRAREKVSPPAAAKPEPSAKATRLKAAWQGDGTLRISSDIGRKQSLRIFLEAGPGQLVGQPSYRRHFRFPSSVFSEGAYDWPVHRLNLKSGDYTITLSVGELSEKTYMFNGGQRSQFEVELNDYKKRISWQHTQEKRELFFRIEELDRLHQEAFSRARAGRGRSSRWFKRFRDTNSKFIRLARKNYVTEVFYTEAWRDLAKIRKQVLGVSKTYSKQRSKARLDRKLSSDLTQLKALALNSYLF